MPLCLSYVFDAFMSFMFDGFYVFHVFSMSVMGFMDTPFPGTRFSR